MALGQGHERLFLSGRQPIGGALGTRAVICQGTLEGREGAMAPFIEDAPAHPEAGCHLRNRFSPEEGEDGLEPMFPGGVCGLWGGLHGGVLLLSRIAASC